MPDVLIAWCDNTILNLADPELDLSGCSLSDIGRVLDRYPRWGARSRIHYGVAAHSLFVADLAAKAGHDSPQEQLECLMHDATEAFVGDMTSHVKAACPEFGKLEQNVRSALARQHPIAEYEPPWVKEFDIRAREIERAFLLGTVPIGLQVMPHRDSETRWRLAVEHALRV